MGEYIDDIVLIGGWIPEVLLPHYSGPHVGSMDMDIARNHQRIQEEGYKRIQDLLLGGGYRQGEQAFIFFRTVKVGDQEITVGVNLLAGEYEGTSKSHRHQKIQGLRARKVRGCDLVFEMPMGVSPRVLKMGKENNEPLLIMGERASVNSHGSAPGKKES